MKNAGTGERLRIRGTVQGVGFRPTVWRLAQRLGLRGRVWNDAEGVVVELWGEAAQRRRFLRSLHQELPPLARIEGIENTPLTGEPPDGFAIVASREGEVHTGVPADAATCSHCLREIFDPRDRRHRYPFTNCTHCGPRFSIVRAIPYDRANTSMAVFPMCPRCRAEYEDPADRRFHAQPNACPDCGPRLWLEQAGGAPLPGDPLAEAVRILKQGGILAVKGIGGFHLACDAGNEQAVAELRRRKNRYRKPFALLARDLEMMGRHARLEPGAEEPLRSSAAPILLLPKAGEPLAPSLAPGQHNLGFLLPYTPLHHLLMAQLERPLVLTSGNRSEEPQCIGNDEARQRLAGIADAFLLHDREILTRLDDSVARVMAGRPRLLRRARGYAPEPLPLPAGFGRTPRVLALGAELKSTFCLLDRGRAILSQHLGDLAEARTWREYRRMLQHYRDLFRFTPELVAVDLHPDYLATRFGQELAAELGVPLVEVQHHHAHLLATLAEQGHGREQGPVLGVALDGLGLGDDGSLWGGEFLLADYRGYQRLAALPAVPMPGGEQAVREPWRNTFAHLEQALGWERVKRAFGDLELVRWLEQRPLEALRQMMARGLNAPPASSAGRLFDAVAAALDVCRESAPYEGAAAMELEALAAPRMEEAAEAGYPLEISNGVAGYRPLWNALLQDLARGTPAPVIAARFHAGFGRAVADTAIGLCRSRGLERVALGGGVFQNRLLLEAVVERLERAGLEVLVPARVPMNDGGVSLGQALAAAALAHDRAGLEHVVPAGENDGSHS